VFGSSAFSYQQKGMGIRYDSGAAQGQSQIVPQVVNDQVEANGSEQERLDERTQFAPRISVWKMTGVVFGRRIDGGQCTSRGRRRRLESPEHGNWEQLGS
jgi:hypothetical protein